MENLVYTELLRRGLQPCYGITSDGFEVDFVVDLTNGRRLAIQVCSDATNPETLNREVRSLLGMRKNVSMLILSLYEEKTIREGDRMINIIPAWKWLLKATEDGK